MKEASNEWTVVVERCFKALDHERIRFNDPTGKCAVASAGAAGVGIGLCVLAAPELLVGAVIITGVVLVAVAIKEELDAYELSRRRPEKVRLVPETKPAPPEPLAKRRPTPEPSGQDGHPPLPPELLERERRPRCEPIPGPPRGGNDLHNKCADNIPNNTFPGSDVFVNGKNFDALQLATRTLWEIKTDDFDKHSRRSRKFFIDMKLPEIQRERGLAEECGYDFMVGVRSAAHKAALLERDLTLKVVVMDWC